MFDLTRLAAWRDLPFFETHLPDIEARLAKEDRVVLPPPDKVFAALEACAPEITRVVILGQDPYPTPGHANGLAFSTTPETRPLPKSLNNIFKELQSEFGTTPPDGDLSFWATQGVLLLNAVLTTPAQTARGHRGLGWEHLTQDVLARLDTRARAFILWGKDAQAAARVLSHPDHLILRTPHPSPLSAYRGFFGSQPFSTVNHWLMENGDTPINWTTPP